MTQIKLDLDEGRTQIVNMCKLVNSLESKEKAISKIITDWGISQSLSEKELHNKILEYFKNRWRKTNSGDWIAQAESRLIHAYNEYKEKIHNANDLIIKQTKLPKKLVEEFMSSDWEDYEEGEDKKKDKVMYCFQKLCSNWASEIGKKYNCEIEHEEFFSTSYEIGVLTIEYCGGKSCEFYLDLYINETIREMAKIFRGSKSLLDIMDENKSYLEKLEKNSQEVKEKKT